MEYRVVGRSGRVFSAGGIDTAVHLDHQRKIIELAGVRPDQVRVYIVAARAISQCDSLDVVFGLSEAMRQLDTPRTSRLIPFVGDAD